MSDLQCPARIRMMTTPEDAPSGERIGLRLDRRGAALEVLLAELDTLADTCRGELVHLVIDEATADRAVHRLVGAAVPVPVVLEVDGAGWRIAADTM